MAKKVKPIKAWAIAYKDNSGFALPDIFQTKEQAKKRMSMNEYFKGQHKWKVILVKIVALTPAHN